MAIFPTILAGQRATASLLNSMLPLIVVKTANEIVNNSAALQNDNELLLAVEANASYLLDLVIFYAAASAADINVDFAMPAGATVRFDPWGLSVNAANNETLFGGYVQDDGTDVGYGGLGTTTKSGLRVAGTLNVSSTAGSLQVRWAQRVANASDATVYAKSWMKLTRYA